MIPQNATTAQILDETHETPAETQPSVYFEALRYASLGFSPVPLKYREKRPLVKWKNYQYRPQDFARVSGGKVPRSNLSPRLNLALRTGFDFGLAVLDFDNGAAFVRAVRANPRILDFPRVRTSRGFHVFFRPRQPERTRRFEGGDIKGEGGLIVVPPSIHPSGSEYRFLSGGDLASIPEATADELLTGIFQASEDAKKPAPTPTWQEVNQWQGREFEPREASNTRQIRFWYLWESLGLETKDGDYLYQCRFHDDTTPSLSIDSRRCVWNCFGCGARGGYRELERRVLELIPDYW